MSAPTIAPMMTARRLGRIVRNQIGGDHPSIPGYVVLQANHSVVAHFEAP